MKIKTLPAYWQKIHSYELFDQIKFEVRIKENPYDIPLDHFFSMAARKNPKRYFLFVSKILGKHIPVDPSISLLGSILLSIRYMEVIFGIKNENLENIISSFIKKIGHREMVQKTYENPFQLPKPVIFIGFAETATALGHGMFESFSQGNLYLHTTRERILDMNPIVSFEEEHSHATAHRCYSTDSHVLDNTKQIVLVDDEITTGKTALNIIEEIQNKYPRKEYVVASLLDWRSEKQKESVKEMEKKYGIRISFFSLISGEIKKDKLESDITQHFQVDNELLYRKNNKIELEYIYVQKFFKTPLYSVKEDSIGKRKIVSYLKETGRFGIIERIDWELKEIGKFLKKYRKGKKTLCLGTGEFMYIPMKISSYMGEGIFFHSTTRSPIYPKNKQGYGIQNAFEFPSFENPKQKNYLYNIPYGYYEELFFFMENEEEDEKMETFMETLSQLGIPKINIVIATKNIRNKSYIEKSFGELSL